MRASWLRGRFGQRLRTEFLQLGSQKGNALSGTVTEDYCRSTRMKQPLESVIAMLRRAELSSRFGRVYLAGGKGVGRVAGGG